MTPFIMPQKLTKGHPLQRSIQKLKKTTLDSKETQKALIHLEHLYLNDQAKTEKLDSNQSRIIDRLLEELHSKTTDTLIQEIQLIVNHVYHSDSTFNLLNNEQLEMAKSIDIQLATTNPLTTQTNDLLGQRDSLSMKKKHIAQFLDKYTIDNHTLVCLSKIQIEFFSAFHDLKEKISLASSLPGPLAQEIMEILIKTQEEAFQRLGNWQHTQSYLFQKDSEYGLFKQAISIFKERPILLHDCLEEISSVRQKVLAKRFLIALTKGGDVGIPRPIEIHAHDPVRYVGDMLAWVHQACANEKEVMEVLFESRVILDTSLEKRLSLVHHDQRSPLSVLSGIGDTFEEAFGVSDAILIYQMMNRNMDSLISPLRTRINHVIQSLIDPVVTYELFELILFYASMTRKIMGESAPIVHQIIQLSESMISHFYSLLTLQSTSLSKELSFIDNSFEALDQTQRIMGQISKLFSILESHASEDSSQNAAKILFLTIPGVLSLTDSLSTTLSTNESAVFKINTYILIESILQDYTFAADTNCQMRTLIEGCESVLFNAQYQSLLQESGLKDILTAIHMNSIGKKEPLSLVDGCSSDSLDLAFDKMTKFLIQTAVDRSSLDLIGYITRVESRNEILKKGYNRFMEDYRMIHTIIYDPVNLYLFPGSLMKRSIIEVETLLGY